jgi:hypothetical protein
MRRKRKHRRIEHQACDGDAREGAGDLRGHIGGRRVPSDITTQRQRQRDQRIEMRARQRRQPLDQRKQCRGGGERIDQQRQSDAATGQPLAEDSGADHGDEEKARAERFGGETARERRPRSIVRRTHQMIWATL